MKKIALILVIIAFMAYNSSAQENGTDSRNKLQFGLKAGANLSNVYDTKGEEFNADPKIGFVTGAFITIPIGKYLGIQPEILFSQKGFKARGRILGLDYEFTRTTNYIDVPLLFSLKPSGNVSFLAGPQYSYLVKQKDVFADGSSSIEQEQEFKNENVRKNILCFLGGMDINLNQLALGARVGFDVLNNNGDGTSTTPRYKNVWFQATLGFMF